MDKNNEPLSSIGEKEFISEVLKELNVSPHFINGFGHDASLFKIGRDLTLAMKIDRAAKPFVLSQGIGGFESWGYLAVTANISDILSVGAIPKTFMISLTLPKNFTINNTKEIINGVVKACDDFNIDFIGGDTKEGKEVNIVGAANGIIYGEHFLSRSKGQAGDIIAIAGELGTFAASYLRYLKGKEISKKEINYMAFPKPKIKEASILSHYNNLINAAMDNSDGLGDIIGKISEYSNVGVNINIDDLPFSILARETSTEFKIPLENFGFFIGDWNIVYTVPEKEFKFLQKIIKQQGGLLTAIGKLTENTHENYYYKNGERFYLSRQIYNEAFNSTFENGLSFSDKILSVNSILVKL